MRTKNPIDALFPQIRQEILAATLLNSDEWIYLRDLAKRIKRGPSSLQRDLVSLVQAGILRRKEEGNRVYFQPDSECPFLSELQGIFIKTVGLLDVIKNALQPYADKIECAFVYGSIARAKTVSRSDVDLMVIGQLKLPDISSVLRKAEGRLGRPVNPTLYTPSEISEKLNSKHHFLQTVFSEEKLFVVGDQDDLAKYGV